MEHQSINRTETITSEAQEYYTPQTIPKRLALEALRIGGWQEEQDVQD